MINLAHITTIDLSLRYLLLNQLKFFKDQGFRVVGISSSGPNVNVIEDGGIQHISVPISRQLFSPLADLFSLVKLVNVLRKEKFQIVHVHTPKASFLGQVAARIAGTPIIIRTLHGFYFHNGTKPLLRKVLILIERFAARYSDAILSQNSEDIKTAVREKICSPEKISFLGNGIDLQLFNPDSIEQERLDKLRDEFEIDPQKKIVGFVGRLVAEKGVLEIFQAIQEISSRLDDVQFLFVGPVDVGKKDAVTPQTAADLGIEEFCKFVGFQDDMPSIYALMNVFVLPSHREGFPRSLMEACAMGVPSIASDIRGCREVVKDHQNGLLVPVKDPDALAEALIVLLNDEKLASEIGQNGQIAAKLNFDEGIVFDKVLQTYQNQLTRKFPS